jgi:hypothetical protein
VTVRTTARAESMQDTRQRAKSNIRLALILGAIALGFFVLGIYLSTGGGGAE